MDFFTAIKAIEDRNRANAAFQIAVGAIVSAHRAILGDDPTEILDALDCEIQKLESALQATNE